MVSPLVPQLSTRGAEANKSAEILGDLQSLLYKVDIGS